MLCALCVYALFNDAVSDLYCDLVVVVKELEKVQSRKPTNNFCQRSRCPSRDSIRLPLKCNSDELLF